MALLPLATEADLLARGIPTTDEDAITALLDSASDAIRDAAGNPISAVDMSVELMGSREQWLAIPMQPVTGVTAVTIDNSAVTDYRVIDGRLWRRMGWQGGCDPSIVTVSATFGYPVVPADIVDLTCSLVAAGLAATEDGYDPQRGLMSVRIDDYGEGYAKGEDEIVNPLQLTDRTREWLRSRFSGGVHVIGTY